MPWIIDYQLVLEQMRAQKLKCLYYNSGAFGFAKDVATTTVAWVGPADPTIKEAVRSLVRQLPPPPPDYEPRLAEMATRIWQEQLPGRVWVMPMSHWAHELDFGSREWMSALMERVQLDPGLLQGRNNAAAIEFSMEEAGLFEYFVQRLLEMLLSSDFMLAFPKHDTLCVLHHHKQLWWTTAEPKLAGVLEKMPLGDEGRAAQSAGERR